MSKQTTITSTALNMGSAVGGYAVSRMAINKVSFLQSIIGKLVFLAVAIFAYLKLENELAKNACLGVAVGVGSSLLNDTGLMSLNGVDGSGVGEIVTGPDGNLYMINGVGELEPYSPQVVAIEGVDGDEDYALYGDDDLDGVDGVDGLSGRDYLPV